MAKAKFYGTGRRKKSVARVYLVPGTGNTVSNPLVVLHSSANVNFSIKRTYKREDNKPRKIKAFRGFLYILTRKDFLQVFRVE